MSCCGLRQEGADLTWLGMVGQGQLILSGSVCFAPIARGCQIPLEWAVSPWRPAWDPFGQGTLDQADGKGPRVGGEWHLGAGLVGGAGPRILKQ